MSINCSCGFPAEHGKTCQRCKAKSASYYNRLKTKAIEAYGGECHVCGCPNPDYLKVVPFVPNLYAALKRQGYPDGFQVLCHNCAAI